MTAQWRSTVRTAMQLGLGLASLALAAVVLTQQVHTIRVLSSSMEPNIVAGDIVLVRSIPMSQLVSGMVYVGRNPTSDTPYMHRITSVRRLGSTTEVRTKGDANPLPDDWSLQVNAKNAYVLLARIPLGWLGAHLPAFMLR